MLATIASSQNSHGTRREDVTSEESGCLDSKRTRKGTKDGRMMPVKSGTVNGRKRASFTPIPQADTQG